MKPNRMNILMLVIMLLVYVLANYYVFYRIWAAMPPNPIARTALMALAGVVVLSFFIFFLVGKNLPVGIASFFYKIGTSWFFVLIYFLLIFIVRDLFRLANRFLHFMPTEDLTRYSKDNWVVMCFIVGFVSLVMLAGYLKYQWKVRVELPLHVEKHMNDSTLQAPLRIVAISDLHLGYSISEKELGKWVDLINAKKPDIVLIAGDVIDNSVLPLNAGTFAEDLKKLHAPKGVYMCLGNHEYISGLKESLAFLDKAGIKVLRDTVVEIDSSFYVVGRDDRSFNQRKPLKQLVDSLDKSKMIILLDHQPYHLEEAEANGIDLQLSGHTHQGQIWPISLITRKLYEQDHGYIKKGNANIYVSSGIGLWGGKFRIGTQSEYVVIDINKKK